MYPKRTDNLDTLSSRERKLVQFARRAVNDTWNGGASALYDAKRAHYYIIDEAVDVVSQVYSASTGKVPDHLDAWECGECGCVHYGIDGAVSCCQQEIEDEQVERFDLCD